MTKIVALQTEALLERMAVACVEHLSKPDVMLVHQACMMWPGQFRTYLLCQTGPWSDESFAAWALQCAKRTITDNGRSS